MSRLPTTAAWPPCLRALPLLALLLLATATARGADRPIEVGPGVDGTLHLPDAVPPQAAVLILHGFNDDRDGVGDLQKRLAAELGARGIASLRFDFSGEGERAAYVVTSTFESRVAEAEQAFGALRRELPDLPRGVQGWSLGGLTAMTIASAHPDWFASMVLWSAAGSMGSGGSAAYNAAVRAAMRDGSAVYSDWTDITLTRDFLVSYVGVDASLALGEYPGSFLTIRGDGDFLPPLDRAWLARLPTTDKAFLLVGGADHIFGVLGPDASIGERVVQASADWFERRLLP